MPYQIPHWMSEIRDDVFLHEMVIPGTHDSCASGSYTTPMVKTQKYDYYDQLRMGIRCFDLRLGFSNDNLTCFHGTFNLEVTFARFVQDCVNFLTQYKSECLLLSISENGDWSKFDSSIREAIKQNKQFFFITQSIPKLGEIRGKIAVMRRWNTLAGPYALDFSPAIWPKNTSKLYVKDGSTPVSCPWRVQDHYNFHEMLTKEHTVQEALNFHEEGVLNVNFLSGSMNAEANWGFSPRQTAFGTGSWDGMLEVTDKYLKENSTASKIGIVMLDFAGEEPWQALVAKLVSHNGVTFVDKHWSQWAVGNSAGFTNVASYTPSAVNALQGLEQAGSGLINILVGFEYPDQEQGFTSYNSENTSPSNGSNAVVKGPVYCPDGVVASGIIVWSQEGYGLVDACLQYTDPTTNTTVRTARLTNNGNGVEIPPLIAQSTDKAVVIKGIQSQEQWGFGLIDLKACFV